MPPITLVEGRRIALSNLEKVLYPDGTTKGEVLHHYATCAPVLLPHLAGRPLSFLRYPDGPEGQRFFAKNVPPGTPEWVTTATVPRSDAPGARQVVLDDLPSLMWAANLVTELHVPQWRAARPEVADRLVFDLDPGAPATIADCCRVALWLRDRLAEDGVTAWPKTSGSVGLHLLAAIEPTPSSEVVRYTKSLAMAAQKAMPELALHRMDRSLRPGKVFIDYSQNAHAKTTAAPYTLRATARPTVSAPLAWKEVAGCTEPEELALDLHDVAARVARDGDLLAPLFDPEAAAPLPS
ncbi:non-homologous end-joining DNA ligase [Streptomyces alkaliterrae]|uniref:ATP-dependent DNA ligase n=1 Tax=Streptomyces alkaliterrae TaxID=2213162 RepID=A0A5P0YPD0_9ACTN|nr:non-homologous end-joining DNA ligase [Streptomyces alkaliterrae]MBB1254367.1 ATP-dependent DNA ligase [Streptomyces alkaliterrae]MBB1258692.1 ATP-dependent DNA ligase [Streptomyces alkaliterrae]MQS02176.1 ATP-dependent DNA ligase [Streptomyces alkaliterrae]